jgi:Bacterial SH3 domain
VIRLALLVTLLPCALHAQLPDFVYHSARESYAMPEMAPPAYVLRDRANLRTAPGTDADVVTQLAAGTRLQIDSLVAGDTLGVDGVRSNWFQVTAGDQRGFLWGGAIAQQGFGSTADPSVKFVAGLERYQRTAEGNMDIAYRIVALRAGREVDRIIVRSFAWGFADVNNIGNGGLRSVDDVITLHVPCVGGCGCTTGDVVVFWSAGRLHHAADVMGSADGAYSEGATFIYPADMEGVPDAIIRVTDYAGEETPRFNEEGGSEGYLLTRGVRRERLVWNGSALVVSGPAEESSFQVVVD